jgi:predicted nucleic acid-binding protein
LTGRVVRLVLDTTLRIAPDPDDDVVIGTALAAKADLIVTGDEPLLPLADHQGVRIDGVSQAVQIVAAS